MKENFTIEVNRIELAPSGLVYAGTPTSTSTSNLPKNGKMEKSHVIFCFADAFTYSLPPPAKCIENATPTLSI